MSGPMRPLEPLAHLGLVVVAIFISGCSSVDPRPSVDLDPITEHRAIAAIWDMNAAVVLDAIDFQGELDQERFSASIEFFEALTGILSDTGTYFGRMPTPGLKETVRDWNAWFEENKNHLVIEPSACLLTKDSSQGSNSG